MLRACPLFCCIYNHTHTSHICIPNISIQGKTAAFALPMVQLVVEEKQWKQVTTTKSKTNKGDNNHNNHNNDDDDDDKDPRDRKKKSTETVSTSSIVQCHLSKQDREQSLAIHPDMVLRCQSKVSETIWAGCRTNVGINLNYQPSNHTTPRKFVYEVTPVDEVGIVRVGWSMADASLQLGTDTLGYGYGGTGMVVHNNKYQEYPSKENKTSFGKGDVIGCLLQLEMSHTTEETNESKKTSNANNVIATLRFAKNGTVLDEAFRISASLGGGDQDLCPAVLFPTVCLKNAECDVTFGNLKFSYEGHVPLDDVMKDKTIEEIQNEGIVAVNPRDEMTVPWYAYAQKSKTTSIHSQGPFAIVIEPTRDLAQQTFQVLEEITERMAKASQSQKDCLPATVQSALLVGGIKPTKTIRLLEQNKVDILVGTPPIIASFVKKGIIPTSRCRLFCLDEADELIKTDSIDHVKTIYGRILAHTSNLSMFSRLQVCFFSATLHDQKVQALAETICHRPLWVDLRGNDDSTLPDTVHHIFFHVPALEDNDTSAEVNLRIVTDAVHRHGKLHQETEWDKLSKVEVDSERVKRTKPRALLDILEKFQMDQVLIFCRTNLDCDLMEKFFQSLGGRGPTDKYTCRVLAGMRTMEERQASLADFKQGEVRILIATDVAARGIDIRELPFVINYTLPDRPETYVHRVGRVGRAERMGLAISLVSSVDERVWFCRQPNKPPCDDTRDFDKGGKQILS